jgi:GTPase SAR1 family protein
VEALRNLDSDEIIFDDTIARHISTVWSDPGIKNMYLVRSRFQLLDSAAYFFDRVLEYARPDFCPTYEDILRCRTKTTGIVETKFEIKGNQFHVFDVGGQRNERRKWIHCFEGVTAVIFVAAISAYNQTLYEDNTINRLAEALALFEEIANSRWFRDTAIILFLNKSDLFREKIKKTPITITFPDYDGEPHDFDQSAQYIQNCFEERNISGYGDVYTHITCATDTSNVNRVFLSAKDIVIRASLKKGGLM